MTFLGRPYGSLLGANIEVNHRYSARKADVMLVAGFLRDLLEK